jgi:hypothetical protein
VVRFNIDDPRMVSLAGHRLADVPDRLRDARSEGAPTFSGIGETLPQELGELAAVMAKVLTALDEDDVRQALRNSWGDIAVIERAVDAASIAASAADAAVVVTHLDRLGLNARSEVLADRRPLPAWRQSQAVVVVHSESWVDVLTALQGWSGDERADAGLTGRVVALVAEDGELLPMGLAIFGTSGAVLPLQEEDLAELAESMNMPLRQERVCSAIQRASAELVAYSYEGVRRATREAAWSSPPRRSRPPAEVEASLRELFAGLLMKVDADEDLDEPEEFEALAVNLILELCDGVAGESPRDGLAAQLASIDITALAAPPAGELAALFNAAYAAALEADRHRRSS